MQMSSQNRNKWIVITFAFMIATSLLALPNNSTNAQRTEIGAPDGCPAPGSLDLTYNNTGITTAPNGFGTAAALQSDQKVVMAGGGFVLARYNTNGTLDPSFIRINSPFGTSSYPVALVVQPDGRKIAAGYVATGLGLVRYNADGTLDTSFNSGGTFVTQTTGPATSLALQTNGSILVGAGENVLRFNSDGSLDPSFDGDGIRVLPVGVTASAVALSLDGSIFVAGSSSFAGGSFVVARLLPDGTLDTSFNGTGIASTPIGNFGASLRSMVLQPDGKIVVAGEAAIGSFSDFALVRWNTDGSLDGSFDVDGKVTTSLGPERDLANSVAVQADGRIIAGGYSVSSSNDLALVRYNANGSLDASFGNAGRVVRRIAGSTAIGNSVLVQSDGNIILAGSQTPNTAPVPGTFVVARFIGRFCTTASLVSIEGRVITLDGRGLRNATVSVTDSAGNRRSAPTSSFGYYRIDGIEAGSSIAISVRSNRYRFVPRTINVLDSLTAIDFVAAE